MWETNLESLEGGRVRRYRLKSRARPLDYAQAINSWQYDAAFRDLFIGLLADAPFAAYFWETPPVATATLNQPFEFVLVNSPEMAVIESDPVAFAGYFSAAPESDGVVSFMNLGRDARLFVPRPVAQHAAYASMATFARNAPNTQQHKLWQAVGLAMQRAVKEQTVWLSTCGLGVSWLHVRLDKRPKYYRFAPYRDAAV